MRSTSQRIILVGAILLIAGCVERTVRMYPDSAILGLYKRSSSVTAT